MDLPIRSLLKQHEFGRRISDDGDLYLSPTPEMGDLSQNISEAVEQHTVSVLLTDAGRHYESDGFDMDTFREIAHDFHEDGFAPGVAVTNSEALDAIQDGSVVSLPNQHADIDTVKLYDWRVAASDTPRVLSGTMVFVADNAVAPDRTGTKPLLVRHPDGVAVYEF